MDKIAIIIVHYNTDQDTRELLASLTELETAGLTVEIYVVDNASKEPFVLSKHDKVGRNVRVIRSDTNLGFAGGNNLGFAAASKDFNPDYFLALNSDTLVKPDFLVKLYQALQAHPDWGMVTPKIYFAPGSEFHQASYQPADRGRVIWFAGGSLDWDNLLTIHQGVDEVDRGQLASEQTVDFATGCCFLVRREVLASVGVFDERYFLYYEDTDLSYRLCQQGFLIGWTPEAVIWHKNGGSSEGSGGDLQTFYQTRNRLLFFAEHGSGLVKLRTWRLAARLLWRGSRVEKLAARSFWRRRFGKQVVI